MSARTHSLTVWCHWLAPPVAAALLWITIKKSVTALSPFPWEREWERPGGGGATVRARLTVTPTRVFRPARGPAGHTGNQFWDDNTTPHHTITILHHCSPPHDTPRFLFQTSGVGDVVNQPVNLATEICEECMATPHPSSPRNMIPVPIRLSEWDILSSLVNLTNLNLIRLNEN